MKFAAAVLILVMGVGWIGFILYSQHYSDIITVRNISGPTGVYTVPYKTHGGPVYMSRDEQRHMWAFDGLGVLAAVITASAAALINRKKRSRTPK
jgi:hypothetical protein